MTENQSFIASIRWGAKLRQLLRKGWIAAAAALAAVAPVLASTPAHAEGSIQFTVSAGSGYALYHDPGTFLWQATFIDDLGSPVVGDTIYFYIGTSLKCKGVTDVTGTASCTVPNRLQPIPGNYTVTAYAGGISSGVSADTPLLVDVGDSYIRLVKTPSTVRVGSNVTYSIRLEEGDGGPPPGAPIRGPFAITMKSNNSGLSQTCRGRTGRTGAGSCTIKVGIPRGPMTVDFQWGPSTLYDATSAETAMAGQVV